MRVGVSAAPVVCGVLGGAIHSVIVGDCRRLRHGEGHGEEWGTRVGGCGSGWDGVVGGRGCSSWALQRVAHSHRAWVVAVSTAVFVVRRRAVSMAEACVDGVSRLCGGGGSRAGVRRRSETPAGATGAVGREAVAATAACMAAAAAAGGVWCSVWRRGCVLCVSVLMGGEAEMACGCVRGCGGRCIVNSADATSRRGPDWREKCGGLWRVLWNGVQWASMVGGRRRRAGAQGGARVPWDGWLGSGRNGSCDVKEGRMGEWDEWSD